MSGPAEEAKRHAAERAAGFVVPGMRLGLGTGSTVRHFVDILAERLGEGTLTDIVGVATSSATAAQASHLGVPLATLDQQPQLDLTVDGADEISAGLDLIKGHGGALLWEKLVACCSTRLVIIADESKLVHRLGAMVALPVEVVPFGWSTHLRFIEELGARPVLRTVGSEPFVTDGGHYLIDCHFAGGMGDPAGVGSALKARVGIVETGLFIAMADTVIVAGEGGVRTYDHSALP